MTDRRNKWTFALGTLGRDMVYSLVAMYLIVYLTETVGVSDAVLWWVATLILGVRLIDAVLDIGMGGIVDNTRTRWGPYKPWIAGGALASALFTVLLFTDLGLDGPAFIVVFTLLYLLWSLSWTTNDIPYWSLLPALSVDPVRREEIGALAKLFGTIGLFAAVVSVIPVTNALATLVGEKNAWMWFAIGIVTLMVVGQVVTLLGVREPQLAVQQERTTLRDLARAVFGNDQLLWTAIAMVLFLTGYLTTASFGVYFFKYAYRDEGMYSPFAAVLGVAQLIGFGLFPVFAKRFSRRALFTGAIAVILLGYVIFFFAPMNMLIIGLAGLLLFLAEAFIVVLMMMFVTDSIEYGHWKLGRRNVAVSFALQPFINKVGGALSTQVVGVTVILAGINSAASPDDVTEQGLLIMKGAMMGLPVLLIAASYLIYRLKYRIDPEFYARIVADLKERGQLTV